MGLPEESIAAENYNLDLAIEEIKSLQEQKTKLQNVLINGEMNFNRLKKSYDELYVKSVHSLSLEEIKKRLDELCPVYSYLRKADQLDMKEVYKALGVKERG